ncbi:MAG: flagellar hook-basal body complex protein FliE [Peptococcaceae bacterium]
MKILPVQPFNHDAGLKSLSTNPEGGFQDFLKNALSEVNNLQLDADSKALGFSSGVPDIDVHDVTIGLEKAHLALQLTIEIRNKLVEAYQEVMRMQV